MRKTLELNSAYKLSPEHIDTVFLSTVSIKLKAFERYQNMTKVQQQE